MKINISELENAISEEINSSNNGNNANRNSENPYKIFYPFNDGEYEFRIFFNFKANRVQRLIIRHNNDGKNAKVPCLSAYGEDCPACKAIKDVENALGKDIGVFRRYGYSKKGICYAQIIQAPDKALKGENAPQKGDIVLLMYPKSVFDSINSIIMSAIKSDKIDDIVNKNVAYHISLNRDSSKGPNGYQVIQTFNQSKLFNTDEEFDKFISELPNLDEQIVPTTPKQETFQATKAFAEVVTSTYLNGAVSNPNESDTPQVQKSVAQKLDEIIDTGDDDMPWDSGNNSMDVSQLKEIPVDDIDIETETESKSSNPECFGKYNKDSSTCWLCPCDIECQKKSK